MAGRRTRWVAVATGLGYGGAAIGSSLSGIGRFLDRLKAEVSSSIQYRGGGLYPAILVFPPNPINLAKAHNLPNADSCMLSISGPLSV